MVKTENTLMFELHSLYASILEDGAFVRRGEVMGLDGDLRRVIVAPFDGVIRLLVTGTGSERRVKVFFSEQKERPVALSTGITTITAAFGNS